MKPRDLVALVAKMALWCAVGCGGPSLRLGDVPRADDDLTSGSTGGTTGETTGEVPTDLPMPPPDSPCVRIEGAEYCGSVELSGNLVLQRITRLDLSTGHCTQVGLHSQAGTVGEFPEVSVALPWELVGITSMTEAGCGSCPEAGEAIESATDASGSIAFRDGDLDVSLSVVFPAVAQPVLFEIQGLTSVVCFDDGP